MFSQFGDNLGMDITGFEILNRLTDSKAKTDRVWVKANIASEAATGEVYYLMDYKLYDNGWALDNVEEDEVDSWSFVPLRGKTDEEIAETLRYFDEYEILSNELDLETGTQEVVFTSRDNHTYCTTTAKDRLVYKFGTGHESWGTGGPGFWGESFETLESETVWDFSGKYMDSDGRILTVSEVDESKAETSSSRRGIEYQDIGDINYRWSYWSDDRDDETWQVTARNELSAEDYYTYSYWFFDYINNGYSTVCDNFDWYDVEYIVNSLLYITPDHIYGHPDGYIQASNRTIHLTAEELIPVE